MGIALRRVGAAIATSVLLVASGLTITHSPSLAETDVSIADPTTDTTDSTDTSDTPAAPTATLSVSPTTLEAGLNATATLTFSSSGFTAGGVAGQLQRYPLSGSCAGTVSINNVEARGTFTATYNRVGVQSARFVATQASTGATVSSECITVMARLPPTPTPTSTPTVTLTVANSTVTEGQALQFTYGTIYLQTPANVSGTVYLYPGASCVGDAVDSQPLQVGMANGSVAITPTAAGAYRAQFVVIDGVRTGLSDCLPITVMQAPEPPAPVVPPASVVPGPGVTLTPVQIAEAACEAGAPVPQGYRLVETG